MIDFINDGQVQEYTLVLSKRNHEHLGQLRNIGDLVSKINLSSANEISFIVYKYTDKDNYFNATTEKERLKYIEPLWDEITDFKYIYVAELDEYYEISVENNDEEALYKSVTGSSACECELSQSKIYGLEINSEIDIARTDYTTPTVFYDPLNPKSSLLNRALSKLPQYSIEYVDTSLMKLQRTFSVDDVDVYSFLTSTVAEEIGCLFTFNSVKRSMSVYDLKTVCLDCGHRGEFSDECPKCHSTNLKYFGEDTTIYVDTENLANSINSSVDVDSVKNCFKLVAGDDNMTAAVANCNPNGSSYIYYFSEDQKHEMPEELVNKIESYDKLVDSYTEEYQKVMANMYEAIDKIIYYTSGMMPKRENEETDAKKEAAKLTESEMSPLGMPTVTRATSLSTVNTALKTYVKVFIKSGYFKAEPNESEFEFEGTDLEGINYGYWYGNFKVTNYSDEEDTAISPTIKIKVYDLYQTFLEQKIEKKLATYSDEEGSIFDVLKIKELDKFKEAITLYGLNRLKSFYEAIQGVIDIMIEEDQANENADLYNELYIPYHDKLVACQEEIDKRNATIDEWGEKLDQTEADQKRIQGILDFEKYLGEDMYKVFCSYKREDTYQNDNYISDGFENDEIFKRANEFLDAAKEELIKSGEHQRSISGDLNNLLAMEEFSPLVDYFKVGNFIRVGTDNQIYRLRLVSYQVTFSEIAKIDVEFSDVVKLKNGFSDLQSILDKTKSMATSYDSVAHQARSSQKQADVVKNWVKTGLDATLTKIVNNADNQNITMGDTGLLARRKDDFSDKYDDCQLKLLSTGLYVTDDNWRSVKTAIGKSYFTNPETGKQQLMYGVNAETLVGQMILGNQLGIYSSDGSSEMRFDNFGLVLNAIDNGSGHYRRILDIQKDGVSQMYVDSDGNIVLATKQQIETTESIGRLNALYADIKNLYVSNATIENLLAKYATIENLEAVKATIKDLNVETLRADFAEIKKLIATDAEIGDLKADNVTIAGHLKANTAEIESLKSVKVDVGELEAYKATVNKLFASYASIEYLESNYIKAKTIETNYAKITELDAAVANINTLKTNLAQIETLVADKASIKDLNAVTANIETINASLANINELVAKKASIDDLNATNAKIDNLVVNDIKAINASIENIKSNYVTTNVFEAKVADIDDLIAKKATIEDLNATKITVGEINAQVANIGSILAGNIGTGTLQTVHLTAENVVLDEAVIKELIAANINVSDLKAGEISTNKFTIKSSDGGMRIVGSTQQFLDSKGNVRVQIGKDEKGNFNFILFDEDGKGVLLNQDGLKAAAISDGLIVDKMVADNASIQGKKLDIDSVIDRINEDGSRVIKSSKIWMDEENQSLGAKFNSIQESIGSNNEDLTNFIKQTTKDLDNLQGQIDGSIQTFFYEYEPTNTNIPAKEWTTTDLKNIHLGDLFYNTLTGYCYRWQVLNKEYSWQRITDVDVTKALADASKAQETANSKRRVFVKTPTPPYDIGDLWVQGSSGEIMKCKVAKTDKQSYVSSDWEKASKYTDDSKANEVNKNFTNFLQTDFSIEQGRIEQLIKETTIENKDGTTTSLKDAYNQTKSTVDSNITTISNIETSIDNINKENSTMKNSISEIKQTADGVSTTVTSNKSTWDQAAKDATSANDKIDKLQVGGRNLFLNSGDLSKASWGASVSGTYAIANEKDNDVPSKNVRKLTWSVAPTNGVYLTGTNYYNAGIKKGDTVTVSIWCKCSSNKTVNKMNVEFLSVKSSTLPNLSTNWQRFIITGTANKDVIKSNGAIAITFYFGSAIAAGDSLYFSSPKVELGNKATDWSPAPEDLTTSISAVKTVADQTAEKFSWLVKSGTNSTNFILTDRTAELVASQINLKGLVKFTGLDVSAQRALTEGKCLNQDITFTNGVNGVIKYNNGIDAAQYPNATILERVENVSDSPTSSPYCIKITLGSGAFTGLSGFVQRINARANAVFVQRFIAKLPVGYKFFRNSNPMGDGFVDEFITDVIGTGKFTEYVRVTRCGVSGTFQNGGHVFVKAIDSTTTAPTDNNPVVFYLASCTTYDVTEVSDYNLWGLDEIPDMDVTLINGGMIKTKSITTNQLNVDEILAENGTFLNTINAQELNADRITSGKITSKNIDAYGLRIFDENTNVETFSIATDGQVTLRGSVESYDYISGKSGWSINRKGSAEFNDVTVRGSVITSDGGIASSGGLGINLQKNTSFYDGLNDWSYPQGKWSVDQNIKYNGVNTLRYNVGGLLTEVSASCRTPNLTIPAKQGDTFTAQAKFYTENASGITGTQPRLRVIFLTEESKFITDSYKTVNFEDNKWVQVQVTGTAPANTAYVCIGFLSYMNGVYWIAQPKLEEGKTATTWSLSPNDKGQTPRFWAGATYENREYAPFIVYNDGSMKATKGIFGGVFTGDIRIGNVSIVDPSSSNGNDASITVMNGNTGIRAVQLTDTSQSSFAQNISITDNFYNEQIRLTQGGTVNALKQFSVGNLDGSGDEKSVLTNSYLQFKGGTITSSDKKIVVNRAESFDVGTISNNTDLTVYGTGNFKNILKVFKEINFNDTVKCTISEKGLDFNFYDDAQTKTCTVKWNTQGGSTLPDSYALQNEFVSKPNNPTYSDGASFIGWYKDKACTQEWSFDYPVVDDMTLYAKWEEPSKPEILDSDTNQFSYGVNFCLGFNEELEGTKSAGNDWTIVFKGTYKGKITAYKWTADMYIQQMENQPSVLEKENVLTSQTKSSVSGEILADILVWDKYYELMGTCTITVKLGNTTKTFSYNGFYAHCDWR